MRILKGKENLSLARPEMKIGWETEGRRQHQCTSSKSPSNWPETGYWSDLERNDLFGLPLFHYL